MPRNRSNPHAQNPRRASNRKRLSQNFLIDPGVARMIAHSSRVGPDDLVVEIGPGDGMLTRQLLGRARRVLAFEKDGRFADRLRRRNAGDDRLRCVHADFRDARLPDEPFAVVANIPYGLTTECVRWCLETRHLTSATLVTQLEFARKHTGDFGRWTKLTVAHWPAWEFTLGRRIGKRNFRPVPSVDSAVLHVRRRQRPLLPHRALGEYRRLVELGFTGVGGSLHASLRRSVGPRRADRACEAAGVARDLPVGLVPPQSWLRLFESLTRS
ncbi:23S ribosomal RNA methyltransferase Erm [Glycomyces salinus]|uniref:23S ribosomal RNA methyltransferase Erm n=1 Tax=Glycomyces salinus TaxID=980294 RepID=UPI0018EDA907|nr:23S ribosomal RNA methyltransferase Erm [Glycomyces salinus]